MLATKRSAGVTSEVNLRNPLRASMGSTLALKSKADVTVPPPPPHKKDFCPSKIYLKSEDIRKVELNITQFILWKQVIFCIMNVLLVRNLNFSPARTTSVWLLWTLFCTYFALNNLRNVPCCHLPQPNKEVLIAAVTNMWSCFALTVLPMFLPN